MPRSWTLSPEAELDEAITWMRKRAPISNREFAAMQENARRTGFWMARVATAQRAKRIQDSLEIALAHGMDFATWKRTNKNLLKRIPRQHLETTFRNWAQTSYNRARINYLSNPQVMKRRPYWVFDAVLDKATTPICVASNGTTLPAGHKWFLTHVPPLHHNCRSSVRGLTFRQAEKLGVNVRSPNIKSGPTKPADGFGSPNIDPWQPTTKDFPRGFKLPKRPKEIELE